MKAMTLNRVIFSLGLLLFCSLGLQACSDDAAQAQNKATITKNDVSLSVNTPRYLVAVDADYAPLVFRNETGQTIGFDVDLLNAIAKDQGFRLDFIPTLWDGIFVTLTTGKYDIVAGGVTITAKRQQEMDMSDPYIDAPVLIVYTDESLKLKDFADLQNVVVGVQKYSTFEEELQDLAGRDNSSKIIPTSTLFLAFKSLVNGDVKAVIGDAPVLRYFMVKYSYKIKKFFSFEYKQGDSVDSFGFVVKKGNHQLLNKINTGLKNIRANGEYDRIYKKWFKNF